MIAANPISIIELVALVEDIRRAGLVPITDEDRRAFAPALVLQGYSEIRAAGIVNELKDNDGALQMLARYRRSFDHSGRDSDLAVAIGEEAFRAGYAAGQQHARNPSRAGWPALTCNDAWAAYEPSEELKGRAF